MTCSQCGAERVVLVSFTIGFRGRDEEVMLCRTCADRGGWLMSKEEAEAAKTAPAPEPPAAKPKKEKKR